MQPVLLRMLNEDGSIFVGSSFNDPALEVDDFLELGKWISTLITSRSWGWPTIIKSGEEPPSREENFEFTGNLKSYSLSNYEKRTI